MRGNGVAGPWVRLGGGRRQPRRAGRVCRVRRCGSEFAERGRVHRGIAPRGEAHGGWLRWADMRSAPRTTDRDGPMRDRFQGGAGTDVPMCSGFPRPLAEMGRRVASDRAESRVSSPSEALAFAKPQVRDSRAKSTREAPTIACYTTRDSCQRTAKYTAERAICAAVARMPADGAGMSLSEGGAKMRRWKEGPEWARQKAAQSCASEGGSGTGLSEGGAKMDASGNAAETGTSTSQTPRLAQASPAPPEHEKSRGRFRSRL